MLTLSSRRVTRLAALIAVSACALAGGVVGVSVAASTTPTVYTACQLKVDGTVRMIDPALGSTDPLGHCTKREVQITWNEVGPRGPRGKAGVSVTTASEPPGPNCAAGGVSLTGSSGTAYVCNGADGQDATGGDADTLSGHPLADFKDGCLSGYVPYGGMCWESTDVTGYTLPQASARCGEMGGRLPTISEFFAIAASGISLQNGLQFDWSSSAAGNDNTMYVDSGSDPSNLDGVRPNTTSSYVRCVVPPSNGL